MNKCQPTDDVAKDTENEQERVKSEPTQCPSPFVCDFTSEGADSFISRILAERIFGKVIRAKQVHSSSIQSFLYLLPRF